MLVRAAVVASLLLIGCYQEPPPKPAAAAPKAVVPAPPTPRHEFKGFVPGITTLEQFRKARHRFWNGIKLPLFSDDEKKTKLHGGVEKPPAPGVVCSLDSILGETDDVTFGGAPTLSTAYFFVDGKLYQIAVMVPMHELATMSTALAEKYGKADVFEEKLIKWNGPTTSMAIHPMKIENVGEVALFSIYDNSLKAEVEERKVKAKVKDL